MVKERFKLMQGAKSCWSHRHARWLWCVTSFTILSIIVTFIAACQRPSEGGINDANKIQSTTYEDYIATEVLEDSATSISRIATQTCHIPDPAVDRASDGRSLTIAPIVFEIHAGLVALSRDGLNSVVPELASLYETSEKGKTYEFTLRKNLTFSDGRSLTSDDVKWSWERALKMSSPQSRATFIFGNILGADEIAARGAGDLTGFEIIDDLRFRVRLEQPSAVFPVMLTDPVASVLKEDNVAQWPTRWTNDSTELAPKIGFERHQLPVGAGPFMLDEFTSNIRFGTCRLIRNLHYWGDPPSLEAVAYLTDSDMSGVGGTGLRVGETLFSSSRIDLLTLLLGEVDDAAEKASQGEFGFYDNNGPATIAYLALNPAVEPFDDIEFRRAVVAATDASMFAPNEHIPIASNLLPPSLRSPESDVSRISFDLDAARNYLAASLHSSSIPIVYRSTNEGWFFDALVQMFDVWEEKIGVKVFRSRDDGTIPLSRSHMRLMFYSPSFPDAHAVLAPVANAFGVSNPSPEANEFRRLINEAEAELDAVERTRKYNVAERYILEQALVLPIWNFESPFYHKVQPWVHGFRVPRYSGSVFHHIEFDETAPKR